MDKFVLDKELLKKLRAQTGAGFSICCEALQKAGNEYDKAVELVRQNALFISSKKSENEMDESVVFAYHHNNEVAVAIISAQTDFALKTSKAAEFFTMELKNQLESKKEKLEEVDGFTEKFNVFKGILGENMAVKESAIFTSQPGVENTIYFHGIISDDYAAGEKRLCKAMSILQTAPTSKSEVLTKLATHICAQAPEALESVPGTEIKGLLDQEYLYDSSKLVKQVLEEEDIQIKHFRSFGK
jgi:translation elongation factor EF-Ts